MLTTLKLHNAFSTRHIQGLLGCQLMHLDEHSIWCPFEAEDTILNGKYPPGFIRDILSRPIVGQLREDIPF